MSGAGELQTRGRQLLQTLYAALQALRLYPLENQAVQNSLDELHGMVARCLEIEGRLQIRIIGDFFFVNEVRIRLNAATHATFGAVTQALRSHGIGTIEIQQPIERSEWPPFLSLLLRPGDEANPFEAFLDHMPGQIRNIDVRPARAADISASDDDIRKAAAKRTYVQCVKVAQELFTDLRSAGRANVRKVKRAVQELVDQVLGNERWILGMTLLRGYDHDTFTHAVNVCILGLAIGKRLGLPKSLLYELGLAGLFHDVGQLRIDPMILAKEHELSPEEWARVRQHPREGLLALFEMHGFAELPYPQLLAAYEHHLRIDGSGYPDCTRLCRPAVFSRIVAVAG